MTKRPREDDADSSSDERFHEPTKRTDMFGRAIPQRKRRKIAEKEESAVSNDVVLQRIRKKLGSKQSSVQCDSAPNLHLDKLHRLSRKTIEKQMKRDGLDKQVVRAWERAAVKQVDLISDEMSSKHTIDSIIEQQSQSTKHHAVLSSIGDPFDQQLEYKSQGFDDVFNDQDKTHFNAIFSTPSTQSVTTTSKNCTEQSRSGKKKKRSWRDLTKKYRQS